MRYDTSRDVLQALLDGKRLTQLRQTEGYIYMNNEDEVVNQDGHYVKIETSAVYKDYKVIPKFAQNILDLDFADFTCGDSGIDCMDCPIADKDTECQKFKMWDEVNRLKDMIKEWGK